MKILLSDLMFSPKDKLEVRVVCCSLCSVIRSLQRISLSIQNKREYLPTSTYDRASTYRSPQTDKHLDSRVRVQKTTTLPLPIFWKKIIPDKPSSLPRRPRRRNVSCSVSMMAPRAVPAALTSAVARHQGPCGFIRLFLQAYYRKFQRLRVGGGRGVLIAVCVCVCVRSRM